jgi:ADP-heptose:LPS heptosyltransferase
MTRLISEKAQFISLQKDPKPADEAILNGREDVIDLTSHLVDFSATAALIACLDIVVTVDTSVAHLSAASGRPTWILLPYTPDYRWLLDRDDSPWYPTVRLFRQDEQRDYGTVIDQIKTALAEQIAEFEARAR